MPTLNIDIETYSSANLTQTSVYKYAEAADFDILLIAYSIDGGEIKIIDTQKDDASEILAYLTNNEYTKVAFNANFERVCLSKYFNVPLTPNRWECTAAQARYNGLPNSLENVAKALKLEEQKDDAGKKLITYFCVPCKPTKANGQRTRNLPEHAPEKWEQFKEYCKQDVKAEMAVREKIQPLPIKERLLYVLDQEINDRGIGVDIAFVRAATEMCKRIDNGLEEELKELTGIDNLNSVPQKKEWLKAQLGEEVNCLDKNAGQELIDKYKSTHIADALSQMSTLAMSSLTKYPAILECACEDNRVHGTLMYYGASTGRWAGKRPQLQNLPRVNIKSVDTARDIVKRRDLDTLEMLYANPKETLAELIRTSFIAPKNKKLLVSDFSAIEARVIAWLANETWRLDVFNTHGKIYEASAAKMYGIPIAEVTKEQRGKGKIAELALGFQGSIGAIQKMGGNDIGLSESDMKLMVAKWRKSNPNIVNLWWVVEEAVKNALNGYNNTEIKLKNVSLPVRADSDYLTIELPSKRRLYYFAPRVEDGKIVYTDKSSSARNGLIKMQTYGGKLTENIVQAIARDCLAEALIRLDLEGYEILFHVHDEVAVVAKSGTKRELETVNGLISSPIDWAPNLPLAAAGYISEYYKKD